MIEVDPTYYYNVVNGFSPECVDKGKVVILEFVINLSNEEPFLTSNNIPSFLSFSPPFSFLQGMEIIRHEIPPKI